MLPQLASIQVTVTHERAPVYGTARRRCGVGVAAQRAAAPCGEPLPPSYSSPISAGGCHPVMRVSYAAGVCASVSLSLLSPCSLSLLPLAKTRQPWQRSALVQSAVEVVPVIFEHNYVSTERLDGCGRLNIAHSRRMQECHPPIRPPLQARMHAGVHVTCSALIFSSAFATSTTQTAHPHAARPLQARRTPSKTAAKQPERAWLNAATPYKCNLSGSSAKKAAVPAQRGHMEWPAGPPAFHAAGQRAAGPQAGGEATQ